MSLEQLRTWVQVLKTVRRFVLNIKTSKHICVQYELNKICTQNIWFIMLHICTFWIEIICTEILNRKKDYCEMTLHTE